MTVLTALSDGFVQECLLLVFQLLFVFFRSYLECVYFIPVDLEILDIQRRRQHLKLRNYVLSYIWEDARVRAR